MQHNCHSNLLVGLASCPGVVCFQSLSFCHEHHVKKGIYEGPAGCHSSI
jgi:hypothetical protein